jgi:ADP-heptose:LPS heptosyltransferase
MFNCIFVEGLQQEDGNLKIKTISIDEAKLICANQFLDYESFNIYKWCIDHKWTKTLPEAYRAMYIGSDALKRKTVLISPWSRRMRNGKTNPKNYPYWTEVVKGLRDKGIRTIQIGVAYEDLIGADEVKFDMSINDTASLLKACDTFVSVDNFLHHMAHLYQKKGVVIYSRTNPELFGYPEQINLFLVSKYFAPNQYDIIERIDYVKEAFVGADSVVAAIVDQI